MLYAFLYLLDFEKADEKETLLTEGKGISPKKKKAWNATESVCWKVWDSQNIL